MKSTTPTMISPRKVPKRCVPVLLDEKPSSEVGVGVGVLETAAAGETFDGVLKTIREAFRNLLSRFLLSLSPDDARIIEEIAYKAAININTHPATSSSKVGVLEMAASSSSSAREVIVFDTDDYGALLLLPRAIRDAFRNLLSHLLPSQPPQIIEERAYIGIAPSSTNILEVYINELYKCMLRSRLFKASLNYLADRYLDPNAKHGSSKFEIPLHILKPSLWPVTVREEEGDLYDEELQRVFESMQPTYSHDIMKSVERAGFSKIKTGEPLDILYLLSHGDDTRYLVRNNTTRDPVQVVEATFQKKYIMVICFPAPLFRTRDSITSDLQDFASIFTELYSTRSKEFELVLVAKMNQLSDSQEVFDHSLSPFPSSCLVVPFKDPDRRDFICCSLGLGSNNGFPLLVIDAEERRTVLYHSTPTIDGRVGPDDFPFTQDIMLRDPQFHFPRGYSLWELLGYKSLDALYNISPAGAANKSVLFSELNDKVVGFYLCIDGEYADKLQEVYQQCQVEKLDFEIVVVYIPFLDCLTPEQYKTKIDSMLRKKNISWWSLPFDRCLVCRFWNLYPFCSDALVIWEPGNDLFYPHGHEILLILGVRGYPFTVDGLIQRWLDRLEKLTLESLLVYGSHTHVLRGEEMIPVENLRGKDIILYMDSLQGPCLYQEVLDWYKCNVREDRIPDFELVFLRQNPIDGYVYYYSEDFEEPYKVDIDEVVAKMPWLVCPYDSDHSAFVNDEFFFRDGDIKPCLVVLKKDGHISSVQGKGFLTKEACVHSSDLREYVSKVLVRVFSYEYELVQESEALSKYIDRC